MRVLPAALTRLTKMSSSELSLECRSLKSMPCSPRRRSSSRDAGLARAACRRCRPARGRPPTARARSVRPAPRECASSGVCSCSVSCFLPSLRISTCLVLDQDQLALADHADAVGHLLGFLDVVRGQDDGHAALAQLAHHLPHVVAQLDVDAGGRLVEEQDLSARATAPWRSARAASCRPTAS